jgi:hypothetical protein
MSYPWNEDGYMGCVNLQRPGKAAPAATLHVVRGDDGKVRYKDGDGSGVILKPTDRARSLLVMEDDTVDRQHALHAALVRDRWQRVAVRG